MIETNQYFLRQFLADTEEERMRTIDQMAYRLGDPDYRISMAFGAFLDLDADEIERLIAILHLTPAEISKAVGCIGEAADHVDMAAKTFPSAGWPHPTRIIAFMLKKRLAFAHHLVLRPRLVREPFPVGDYS